MVVRVAGAADEVPAAVVALERAVPVAVSIFAHPDGQRGGRLEGSGDANGGADAVASGRSAPAVGDAGSEGGRSGPWLAEEEVEESVGAELRGLVFQPLQGKIRRALRTPAEGTAAVRVDQGNFLVVGGRVKVDAHGGGIDRWAGWSDHDMRGVVVRASGAKHRGQDGAQAHPVRVAD